VLSAEGEAGRRALFLIGSDGSDQHRISFSKDPGFPLSLILARPGRSAPLSCLLVRFSIGRVFSGSVPSAIWIRRCHARRSCHAWEPGTYSSAT
jgi:hypothetical protein